jgi:hypothetical protein
MTGPGAARKASGQEQWTAVNLSSISLGGIPLPRIGQLPVCHARFVTACRRW